MSLSQGEVRSQDAVFVIVAVAVNPKGRDMAWEYFKENHKTLMERYMVSIKSSSCLPLLIDHSSFSGRILAHPSHQVSD